MSNYSKHTSRNQIAAGFKKVNWNGITSNFDLGGGKYNKSTNWLKKHRGVINFVYDPYNRSQEYNDFTYTSSKLSESTTIFNVLNVIPTRKERKEILEFAKRENTKYIFITVYEGDKSGCGNFTRDGWQNNKRLKDYLPEVKKIYSQAYIAKNMIIINIDIN